MANIKNLQKAADRILEAIDNKEKIILYGDADLDGVSAVIIVKEAIQNLKGKITEIYFPDREKEGYGITPHALGCLKEFSPALLIALDCGISNFEEIKKAHELGFEVIVIDHHKILEKLPEADIIVDPKQEGDSYPFKELSTGGIAFKLAELMLGDRMSEGLRDSFLELAGLSTMADKMPKEEDNEYFIEEGLRSLEDSWRPGIQAMFSMFSDLDYNRYNRISKIISILNVRDVEDGYPSSYNVLTTSSLEKLTEIISRLRRKNEERQEKMHRIVDEVRERDARKAEPIIFEGETYWDYPLISAVASIISQDVEKPVFLYKKLDEESQGTVRSPPGIDSVELMKKCKQYVETYGGHPRASGFRIKNEKLEKFKNCLIENL
ncbi:MAG: hypothetical protein GF370_02130 [Candidatus Nealsonbacteria bacterium]|nr:hypothetical protein [Candidatus Nealsonbacteria bacterium]